MFLHNLNGLTLDEVLDVCDIQHDVPMMGLTRDGEDIILASEKPEGQRAERVFFIVWCADTDRVTQFWEFPDNYGGMHPVMFLE